MNCRRVEPLLSRHLEGCLSEVDAAAVMTHLANCPACRRFRSELLELQGDLRALPDPSAAPDLSGRAVQTWMAERSSYRPPLRFAIGSRLSWGIAAGVVVLVAGLGPAVIRHREGQPRAPLSRSDAPIVETPDPVRHPPFSMRKRESSESAKLRESRSGSRNRRLRVAATPASPILSPLSRFRAEESTSPSGEYPSPADDLSYLNVDPASSVQPWAALPVDDWAALEAQVRRSVRVRDDFVTLPFPRIAAASNRQIGQAVENYKREAATADARLFQKMTLQVKAVAFDQFCREMSEQSGIQIEANRGVADEKVTAFVKERPLRQIMRQVSRLFAYTWLRSGKPGEYRYELAQDLKSQLLEEELRNRDRNEALLAMDQEMRALRPYAEMTPEEIRAKAAAAKTPEEKKRLQELAGFGWGALQMYFRLSPEELLALRSEQALTYASSPEGSERPLPEELRLPVLGMFSDYRVWRKGDSSGLGPPSSVPPDAEQYEPKAAPEIRGSVSLRLSRQELGQIALIGMGRFAHGGGAMSRDGDLATGISPSVASPGNAKANTTLSRDLALQPLVNWRPESSCRHGVDYPLAFPHSLEDAAAARQQQFDEAAKADRELLVSVADVLAAIHQASGIDILSDHYTRLYPAAEVSVEKTRLFVALSRVADTMRYRWRKEEGMLLFRSAGYFNDKLKEVPNRLLERWAASIREHGRITLDDLTEIASLRDVQLDSNLIAAGAARCYGIKGWELARNPNLRPHLRFLAVLTPEQRRLAQSPSGLPFRQMSAAQQQQYLLAGWKNSSSGLSPEELAGARVRVDLTLPGEFEWIASWQGGIPLSPPVRAASRDLALAAARRIDPTVTVSDILPTVAALQVEYSLGPSSDGQFQFSAIGPNWSTNGRRDANTHRVR